VRKATALYRRKRDLMLTALERHCGGLAQWRTPDGGFFVWVKLARGDVAQVTAAAQQHKVAFLPGPYFSAGAAYTGHLRLSYGQIDEARIEEGIARFGRALTYSIGQGS
jgi:DNA-binding transcriptional MocR family regulator